MNRRRIALAAPFLALVIALALLASPAFGGETRYPQAQPYRHGEVGQKPWWLRQRP
jgi:hypothetical protein